MNQRWSSINYTSRQMNQMRIKAQFKDKLIEKASIDVAVVLM